jgi:hypothetical protein
MQSIVLVCSVIAGIVTTISLAITGIVWFIRIVEGQRCQLRQAMLDIYYKHKDEKKIRQYEAEHFDKCYHAYKALKGNSFIDEIYRTAHTWEVET